MVLALWLVANLIFVSWASAYAYVNWLCLVLPLSTILLTSPRSLPHMRVSELWPLLAPAALALHCSASWLLKLFDPSGDDGGVQLLTVGFNASAWMHSLINVFSWCQAGTGQSHESGYYLLSVFPAISRMLLHPYFVFDGPDCPQLKRGKDVVGFNWHMAPGEADTELTNLQSYRLIEAVVTLYNNTLLFGATCIIRRYEDVLVYSSKDIENIVRSRIGGPLSDFVDEQCGLLRHGLLPVRLAKYGFGRSLLRAATALQFAEFMSFVSKWRDSVCEVLRTDPRQFLGRRHYELARIIVEECIEFPDPTPDLTSLAEFCSQYLDWPLDVIQSRLADARAGATVRALLQLPGNVDGERLRCDLRVTGYFDESLSSPTYKLSVPIQPLATSGEKSNGDPFYDMEIVAVVLEYSRPDLALGSVCPSSPSPCVEFADENADVKDTSCLEAGIDDPMNEG
ncbi:hypothetical protein F5J12DRAFT_939007 [Pisolithus orientalis]|uniref:uncharacterized protein n=1 Tax=Pisolithus orientalis TaxID=936130 RepID=UPI0022243D12|nr:uncharacterized protein F5J12DRAFT_939007 [Pisolithus orientalis]KAI6006496.1 hypothetical protein F5J12DRAFT_939007 [Pisolithus orientalis]